jgi:DNA-binding PadR family transcriptional regulator
LQFSADTMSIELKPAWFHLLLALADGAQHGYAIRSLVDSQSDGRVRLWPATLYGSIRDLEALGLIVETDRRPAVDDDPRRRYFRLTPAGKAALAAETDRLQALVKAARGSRALRGS